MDRRLKDIHQSQRVLFYCFVWSFYSEGIWMGAASMLNCSLSDTLSVSLWTSLFEGAWWLLALLPTEPHPWRREQKLQSSTQAHWSWNRPGVLSLEGGENGYRPWLRASATSGLAKSVCCVLCLSSWVWRWLSVADSERCHPGSIFWKPSILNGVMMTSRKYKSPKQTADLPILGLRTPADAVL